MSTLILLPDRQTQHPWDNELVPKKQLNVWISTDFSDAVEALVPRVGKKRKWMLYAAGLLAFLELPRREQDRILAGIRSADYPGGSYKLLIDAARLEGDPDAVATDFATQRPDAKPPAPAGPAESPSPKPAGGRRAKGRR